jgi:hypothetical protein
MSEESSRLYRIRKTILEMLSDRKYNISEEDLNESLEQFRAKFEMGGYEKE